MGGLATVVVLGLFAAGAADTMAQQQWRMPLNGDWRFRLDPDDRGVTERWHSSRLSRRWKSMPVPAHWEQHGVDGYDGIAWYRRAFKLPADPPKPIGLCVMGVDDTAQVWLNGRLIAVQDRPFERFAVNIDELVKPGENTLAIRVADRGGQGGIVRSVLLGEYRQLTDLMYGPYGRMQARESADWVRDAVLYEVYLRSFSPEGTFDGLRARLGELDSLGVTVLWLMPIHPVGEKHRKGTLGSPYSISDYFDVNPRFGTLEDFRTLVRAAHQRDMKIVLDLVANHTAWDGQPITDHPEWYVRDEKGNIQSPVADWSDVADLDYSRPEVREFMRSVMDYWTDEFNVDGFRCDVAGMVPLDFWETVVPRLEQDGKLLMLAEDNDPAHHLKAFDLSYDWRLYQALGRLKAGKLEPRDIRLLIRDERLDFPQGSLRMRFTSNHDLNAWHEPAIERYGVDGAKTAAVLTYMLPGVPLIYTGQEVGNERHLHLFEKVSVDWDQPDRGLRELYTRLGELRAAQPALRRGDIRFLTQYEPEQILAFTRTVADTDAGITRSGDRRAMDPGGQTPENTNPDAVRIWAFFNFATKPRTVTLPDSPSVAENLVTNGERSGGRLSLPPLGYWIARQ